jgi:hypothetical protein
MATNGTISGFSTVAGYGGALKDPNGAEIVGSGGASAWLNITAAQVIKAAPGRLCKIVILGVVGTGGALTFNDATTVAGATTANQILNLAGTTAVGNVTTIDWPCVNGIVVSAVPTGGTVQINVSYN